MGVPLSVRSVRLLTVRMGGMADVTGCELTESR
jgi:hypothetical protein